MKEVKEVCIIDAVRTPIGSFMGLLSSVPAPELGSYVIKGLIKRNNLPTNIVDEVIMGNVIQAGEGQAPARQAALGAGLADSTQCMTINKVCGSGLKSVMLAAQAIMLGDAEVIIAGGMENMSQIPFYLKNARVGFKMGDQKIVDGMLGDGLVDAYDNIHMGNIAELCASEYNISREEQDNFAIESYKRALNAIEEQRFSDEIIPVEIKDRKGKVTVVTADEEPGKVNFEKLKSIRAVFDKNGTITAANASSINDGASAILLMTKEKADELAEKKAHYLKDVSRINEGIVIFDDIECTRCSYATSFMMEHNIDFKIVNISDDKENLNLMWNTIRAKGKSMNVKTPVIMVDGELSHSHEDLQQFLKGLK